MNIEDLRSKVAQHRKELDDLEARLRRAEREAWLGVWFPPGFYTAFYVLSGLVLGVIASWCTLLLNMLGAYAMGQPPLKLLRVYSTILGGQRTAESSEAVVLIFALGVHTLTGAICGAPIHVVYSRFFPAHSLRLRLANGVWLGAILWLVNFYGILSWLQPALLGEPRSYIVDNIPAWVAFLTHVAFTEVILILQPFGVFHPRNYAAGALAQNEA